VNEAWVVAGVWFGRAVLLAGLISAAVFDHRRRRIPNALTVTLLCAGVAWNAVAAVGAGIFDDSFAGGIGLRGALFGALTGFGVFFPFYLFRIFGAGDVKLMTAVGAWLGVWPVLTTTLLVLISGGVLAAARLFDARRRANVIVNLQSIAIQGLAGGGSGTPLFDPKKDTADRMPYAWAILAGTVVYALAKTQSWWTWL
jgi:prepilin peptidase CpaA